MVFNTKFSLLSFLKQVDKLTEPQRNSITQVGFGHLLNIPSQLLRRSQIEKLMETWNIQKQSFTFPLGDITITNLDVLLILGLRVIGQPVVLPQDTPLTNLEIEFGALIQNRTISIESLKERLESIGERADSSFVRAFLLYCFGTLLFPSANGKVDSRYLLLLEDLDSVSSFTWGTAVKEDLHESLTQWKSKKTSYVKGCLILLQIWCYEHNVIGRPKLLDCPSTFPVHADGKVVVVSNSPRQILWRLEPTSEEIQLDIVKEVPQEWYLRNGLGTMEEPINIESERGVEWYESAQGRTRKRRRRRKEEPMRQQTSSIFVLSDDDESNSIKDLKEENVELKATVEKLTKENEIMKKENEELRMLVEKLSCNKTMMENSVSNLEKILSEYSLD